MGFGRSMRSWSRLLVTERTELQGIDFSGLDTPENLGSSGRYPLLVVHISVSNPWNMTFSHRLHVWYMYLQNWVIFTANVGTQIPTPWFAYETMRPKKTAWIIKWWLHNPFHLSHKFRCSPGWHSCLTSANQVVARFSIQELRWRVKFSNPKMATKRQRKEDCG